MGGFAAILLVASGLLTRSPPAAAPCPKTEEILWSEAGRCLGETRRVVGRLDHVSRSKKGALFLNFCADFRQCPFTAVVFRDRVPAFSDVVRFAGSEVELTGRIGTFRGQPQIVLEERGQLVVRTTRRPAPSPVVEERPPPPAREPAVVAAPQPAEPPPSPRRIRARAPLEPVVEVQRVGAHEVEPLIGERARVSGRVLGVTREGDDLVVHFTRDDRELRFVAVVLGPHVPLLGQTARGWVDRQLEIEGDVTVFDGRPSIFLSEAAQVTVVDAPRAGR